MYIFLLTAGDEWNIKVKYELNSRRGTIFFHFTDKQELILLSNSHVESQSQEPGAGASNKSLLLAGCQINNKEVTSSWKRKWL